MQLFVLLVVLNGQKLPKQFYRFGSFARQKLPLMLL
jgi:hypothetical protein